MVKNNEYIIPKEINKKPFETVQGLKDEYKIPSFEEFNKNYDTSERINDNYQDEFDSYGDIRINRSYGPGNSQSADETAKKVASEVTAGALMISYFTPAAIVTLPATAVAGVVGAAVHNSKDGGSELGEFVRDVAIKSAVDGALTAAGGKVVKTVRK